MAADPGQHDRYGDDDPDDGDRRASNDGRDPGSFSAPRGFQAIAVSVVRGRIRLPT
jgi:hypothetical protein